MPQKKVFLNKMCILGALLAIKVPRGREPDSKKWVNGEVSGIVTCKFEFSTIKNPYNDKDNGIFDNHHKKPQKGVFFSPKSPQETRTGVLPGPAITILCSHQLSSHFGKIS